VPSFAHLAVRTCYSLRDGIIRPRELAEAVAERGMTAVGVADRAGLYGAVRVAQACAATGVTPIFAADLALAPDTRPGWEITRGGRNRLRAQGDPRRAARSGGEGQTGAPEWAKRPYPPRGGTGLALTGPTSGPSWLEDDAARIVVLARNPRGYAALCRLVSTHHLDSARSDPHATWAQLGRWLGQRDGDVFLLLGDDSPVGRLLDAGRGDAARVEARAWMDLVGRGSVLVGVTHHRAPGDDGRARVRFALADDLGLRAVANQAPRYLDAADARVADVMDAVRLQVPLDQRHSTRRNAEGYLKDPHEMGVVFAERPDALVNAGWAAERCVVDLELGKLRVPDFVALPDGEAAQVELRARCEAGIDERYASPGAQHRELLERELDMVAHLGLAPYFLTVAEIVARIREKGIMAACRGSAAGSLVIYALRISDVDPIAHDLAFERFMNPYRDELPDIDIDVESARREDIYRDLIDRYGDDRVACVAMVDTFKARMAIREVGKALGLPPGEIDVIAKSFPRVRARDVRPALAHLPELQGLNLDRPDLQLLFDVVERLDALPRHIALHPCGVLLADSTLRDLVPLERSANGFAMAQFDKDDVEALGLCKLDILAVRMLSAMSHAADEVRRVRGEEIDFAQVPWNDEASYELIRSTRTIGMFQIESPGQRELVGKFQPEHLGDLVVDISLFRPGPVKGDMIGPFLDRRHRAQVAEGGSAQRSVLPHPILERALGETFGVIVYHEQVMRSIAALTGCDLSTADLVRRRLSDPEQVADIEAWVLAGAKERGVPDDVAASLWHALVQFASFGFCKAHAAAFSVPTYRSAWLKAHYCPEFVAGLLTHDPGMYPRRLILDDARQFGIAVLGLDVNRSAGDYRVERLPAADAHALLGVHGDRVPRGWRTVDGVPVPPAGFDFGADPDDPAWRFAIRLGLQDVSGIDDAMVDSVLAGRPFTCVEDLRRRTTLSQPVAAALTHAGALDELGGVGTAPSRAVPAVRTRRDLLLEVTERWATVRRLRVSARAKLVGSTQPPAEVEQLSLLAPDGPPGLPEYRPSEQVRAELEVVGMDASTHVIRFYEGLLDMVGVTRAVDLADCRKGQRVRVAGVKIATQTPPVKSGQRIIFLSLDDGTGIADATFFESVHDRCAWTVFHSWLLVVEGTVHRAGRRGISLNAERVWDLRRLMRAWREDWLDEAIAEDGPTPSGVSADRRTDGGGAAWDVGSPGRIEGAAGRSGLRLPAGEGQRTTGSEDRRGVVEEVAALAGAREQDGASPDDRGAAAANARWLATPPGAPSRIGPNGTTWADPAGRHPGVDLADVHRLAPGDPRHPDHPSQRDPRSPSPRIDDDDDAAPRKLWHTSDGSAGG
jgi:error-prone DNA polymerase